MKKFSLATSALSVLFLVYAITLIWFLYVGPYSTYKVKRLLQNRNQRIVISLTTTPYRITKIKDTLDSLLDQSVRADQIYLHIPYFLKRDALQYTIPEWLQKYPGITIHRGADYGPITKLLPTLDLETDPNTIIITVDDDVWYPRHVVRDLAHYALEHNAAVTPLNINFTLTADQEFANIEYKFQHAAQVALVVGAAGVAYKRSFFAADFNDFLASLPATCLLADDLIISMYLAHNNIAIQQTTQKSFHPLVVPFTYRELPHRFGADALSASNDGFTGNQRNYAQCLHYLCKNGSENSQIANEFVLKYAHLNGEKIDK